uniref:Metalloendopeptidase n=1 Tax=Meloidogyne javanica TaxID=6303 RepID=A0A915LBY1_MELJA
KACQSTVGYVDKQGRNRINLEPRTHCEEPNTVIHEIMHCLGVSHEQMRYDRDEYIEVLYDNLEPKAVSQYKKQSRKDLETYGEPYDYGSIMHYQVHAGSKNGLPAFRVLRPYDKEYIGNARIPSLIDFSKLNKLYGCPQPDTVDSSSGEKACKSTVGYVDKQGRNIINLEPRTHCEEPNTVIHEIMHCLGVSHEQMRYDRDEYIQVLFDNLMPDTVSQYYKQSRKDLETYGEPYDYGSIMHYEVRAGTKYGLPGFRVLRSYNEDAIGHAKAPSRIDLRKLNKLYGCPAR